MTLTVQEFKQAAEEYIDSSTVANALDALGEICLAKAEHIRVNWQDEQTAKVWEQQGRAILYAGQVAERRGL